jgi:hypothetical protein
VSTIDEHTRKPVCQLTLADLVAFPIWEYADEDEEGADDRDETWVRPVAASVVPECSYTHVAAKFTAACGEPFEGFVTVSTLEGAPDVCQGAILHEGHSLFIANPGSRVFTESGTRLLAAVALTEAEVFPLRFRLRVPVAGWEYTGGRLP